MLVLAVDRLDFVSEEGLFLFEGRGLEVDDAVVVDRRFYDVLAVHEALTLDVLVSIVQVVEA